MKPKKPRSGEGKLYRLPRRMLERAVELATETIAEKQARLDAIAAIWEHIDRRGGSGYIMPTEEEARAMYVLASGRPARECRALVRKWGKEKR